MALPPEYGQTPVPGDELQALLPAAQVLLGEPVTKAAVYDLEQALQAAAAEELMSAVLFGVDAVSAGGILRLSETVTLTGEVTVHDLVSDSFLRALHQRHDPAASRPHFRGRPGHRDGRTI